MTFVVFRVAKRAPEDANKWLKSTISLFMAHAKNLRFMTCPMNREICVFECFWGPQMEPTSSQSGAKRVPKPPQVPSMAAVVNMEAKMVRNEAKLGPGIAQNGSNVD